MRREIALIRGINVGRAKRVAMADLRSIATHLGYANVRTLLNSGNLLFDVPGGSVGDSGIRIEQAIATRLGIRARVTVLTAAELASVVRGNPLLEIAHDPTRLLISFLSQSRDRQRLKPLRKLDWTPEALEVGSRVAYLWCPHGILKSPVATAVNRVLGDAVTSRNWSTLKRLHALASDLS